VAKVTEESLAKVRWTLFTVGMTTMMQRLRNRHRANVQTRAIQQAMRNAPSPAAHRELLEIATRQTFISS
jgi:hypothetical protein